MSPASDADVIGRSLVDAQAFAAIFDRHAEALLRYAARRAGREVAEGLIGELFRIAFERRKSFDSSYPSARPWLYGIASNLLHKHRRAEARRLRASARLAAERRASDAGRASREAEARILLPSVVEAIEALPEAERETLLLYAWEELPYDAIAAALNVPVGTVRSRLNRARARLRELDPPERRMKSRSSPRRSARRRP
jgi:RNA polymerase sigma-70 factor (ECF subfamily)